MASVSVVLHLCCTRYLVNGSVICLVGAPRIAPALDRRCFCSGRATLVEHISTYDGAEAIMLHYYAEPRPEIGKKCHEWRGQKPQAKP